MTLNRTFFAYQKCFAISQSMIGESVLTEKSQSLCLPSKEELQKKLAEWANEADND